MVEPTQQPQVDQNGNPLPAQGAAPGVAASPAGIIAGTPSLADAVSKAYMEHLTTNQPPPTQAVVAQRQAKADAAAPVDTSSSQPNSPAGPAAAGTAGTSNKPTTTGGKIMGAFEEGAASIGDAAHSRDTRGGWFSGIANVLNARAKRTEQNARDEELHAKTQAETIQMHRNFYLQNAEIREKAYDSNKSYTDTMSVNHDIQSDVSQSDLTQKMKDPKFAQDHYVRATSETPVLDASGNPKTDKNGLPVTTPLYSVITKATKDGQPDDQVVTADMSADAKRLLGSTLPKGTKLTGPQFSSLNASITATRNTANILDSTNGKQLSEDQMKTIQPYLSDPTIREAVSHVPGSAYAGLMQFQQNADDHIVALQDQAEKAKAQKDQAGYDSAQAQIKDIQSEKAKVTQFTSQAILPSQIAAYDKKADENITLAKKVLTDPGALTGDKASGVLAQLQENLATATDPRQRVEITRGIAAATVARDNYFEDLKRKANADQFAKQGDPTAAGRLLASHDLTLADLRTRQTTSEFIEQSVAAAKAITNGTYNPADEIAYENVAKSPRNETLFGSSRSIIEAGGTADQIIALGKNLPDTGFPTLNKYEDWIKMEADHGAFSGYASMSLGLADDYGKVMGGGAASDRARDHALSLLAAAHTQDARVAAVREIVNATMSQRKGTVGNNSFLERQYNNFDKSPLATAWTQQNAADVKAANDHQKAQAGGNQQQQKSSALPNSIQAPTDLKGKATGTVQFKDKTTGQVAEYWVGADGKPLRAVKTGELPN